MILVSSNSADYADCENSKDNDQAAQKNQGPPRHAKTWVWLQETNILSFFFPPDTGQQLISSVKVVGKEFCSIEGGEDVESLRIDVSGETHLLPCNELNLLKWALVFIGIFDNWLVCCLLI